MIYSISFWILLITLSLDTFIAGISMGMEKVKVPIYSIILLSLVGTFFLLISCLFGEQISYFLPSNYIKFISTSLFFILGIHKILDVLCKRIHTTQYKVHFSNFECILCIYHNPKVADLDHSKTLSIKELILLGTALSFDNLTVGLLLGLWSYSITLLIIFNFLISFFLFFIGSRLSYFLSNTNSERFTILSGFIFIMVGIYRIFG